MKLSEIEDMLETDFSWNENHLEGENSKSSTLWIKYIKLWSNENLRVEMMESNIKELIKDKRDYYSGNGTPEQYKEKPFNLKIKTDSGLNKYIEADAEVIRVRNQILNQKQKVIVLSACLDEVKRRSFSLKNALDYYRFINGG